MRRIKIRWRIEIGQFVRWPAGLARHSITILNKISVSWTAIHEVSSNLALRSKDAGPAPFILQVKKKEIKICYFLYVDKVISNTQCFFCHRNSSFDYFKQNHSTLQLPFSKFGVQPSPQRMESALFWSYTRGAKLRFQSYCDATRGQCNNAT